DCLGRIAGTSQPHHLGVHSPAARAIVGGVSPGVRARTECGGVFVVPLEAARVTQLLTTELWAIEQSCPQSSAPQGPAIHVGDRFLATSGAISIVTILCNIQ